MEYTIIYAIGFITCFVITLRFWFSRYGKEDFELIMGSAFSVLVSSIWFITLPVLGVAILVRKVS